MPVGMGPERPVVPNLRFDVMVIELVHAIRPDHFGQNVEYVHDRSPVPFRMEPSGILHGDFVQAVRIGGADIVFSENGQWNPDLLRVFLFQIARTNRRFAQDGADRMPAARPPSLPDERIPKYLFMALSVGEVRAVARRDPPRGIASTASSPWSVSTSNGGWSTPKK
jgi:hypothetical protein